MCKCTPSIRTPFCGSPNCCHPDWSGNDVPEKSEAKTQIKLARAQGLLMGAKEALKCISDEEVAKDRLIKLIDEVLELLK